MNHADPLPRPMGGAPLFPSFSYFTRGLLGEFSAGPDTPITCTPDRGRRCHHQYMSAPTVDAAINDLMDWAWHAVYELLAARGLLGEGLDVEEYTGMSSWVEGSTRYTVVNSPAVAILFIDTDPVDAITFRRDLLGSEDPKACFSPTRSHAKDQT